MAVSAKDRELVYERDGRMCLYCGTTEGLTIQHRTNRGMGGSKLLDDPDNLITLCGFHNQALESDPDFAELGRDRGWKLRRYEDPITRPVLYPDGVFYFIDSHGSKTKEP